MRQNKTRFAKTMLVGGTVLSVAALTTACGSNDDSSGDKGGDSDYPTKAVTWIVPFAAGGGADNSHRVFTKAAEELTKTRQPINNVDGAGGVTGWTQFVNSKPDGYTLTLATPPFNIIPKLIQPKVTPYELDQFQYICTFAYSPNALFVATNSKYKDLAALLDAAKANPEKVTVGTTGAVGTDSIHMYQLQDAAGVKFKMVPFESGADAAAAGSSGDVDVVLSDIGWAKTSGGKLKPLAVESDERLEDYPDVPTYKELGYDIIGLRLRAPAAPKGTPDSVMKYWEDICKKVTEDPEFQDGIRKVGQIPGFKSAEETTALVNQMASDTEKIVKDNNLAK